MLILCFLHHLHKTNIVLYIKCLGKLHYTSKKCQENKVTTVLKKNNINKLETFLMIKSTL
jgi:hypothetical protein